MAQKKRCIKQVAFEGEGLMKYQALQVNVYTSWIKKLCYLRNYPIIHPAKVFIFPLQSRSPAIIYNFLADGNIYVRVCSVIKQQYVMPREMPAEDKHWSL